MPLYEYICNDCGHRFDALRSMKEADNPINCKKCHHPHTKRALSVFFAQSQGHEITSSAGGKSCSGCSGGSCGSCCH